MTWWFIYTGIMDYRENMDAVALEKTSNETDLFNLIIP